MKILFVIPYFYPAQAFGGPVKVVFDIGRELVKRGHEVVVFTSDAKDLESRLNVESDEVEGVKIYYFRSLSMSLAKKSKLFITPKLSKKMKSDLKSFDIIHTHEYRTYQNIIVHKFAKKNGVPYILQAHGALPRIGREARKWLYDFLFGRRILKGASKVIALSRVEAEQYKDMSVPEDKIEIIPNGIDLSEYANLPPKGSFKKKFNIDDDKKIVLYLGRIHESKGLEFLAEAFSVIAKRLENVRLVVAGPDDGYAAIFSRLISDLGIEEKVLLTGFVEERDKLAALVDSDVFVTPRFYGFPVTFLEACVAGCPIVTTSKDLDWIQSNVGYVTEETPVAFSKAIIKILRNEQIREEFRANCVDTVRKFDTSVVTSQIESRCYSIAMNRKL